MPGRAMGNTTLIAVCQGVAPKASEPARRWLGTLESASSQMVKTSGTTAKPMAKPHYQAIALVVANARVLPQPAQEVPVKSQFLKGWPQRVRQTKLPAGSPRRASISPQPAPLGAPKPLGRIARPKPQLGPRLAQPAAAARSPTNAIRAVGPAHKPARKPKMTLRQRGHDFYGRLDQALHSRRGKFGRVNRR